MKFSGKVTGFDEFAKLLEQLPRNVENKVLQDATRNTLKKVALPALKQNAPRHSGKRSQASLKYGTLRSNIRVAALKKKRKNERGAVVHTGRGFWGYILEKGSRHIAAMPWFFPTFQSRQAAMIQELGEEIGAGIEREAEKSYRGGR